MVESQKGFHYLIEMSGCIQDHLSNPKRMQKIMHEAAQNAGTHVIQDIFHAFDLGGVVGALIMPDSHFAIHSWPDKSYVAVDIFTTNNDLRVQRAIDYLGDVLSAKQVNWQKHSRGLNAQLLPFKESHSISI